MAQIRDGGGTPILVENPVPQIWRTPNQSIVNLVDTTATQTLTNKAISGPAPIAVTTSTTTLGASNVGRVTVLNRATGIAVTLPAATGSGDTYPLFVSTSFTSTGTVRTATTTEVLRGTALLFQDSGDTVVGFNTTASDNTLSMTGAATGGLAGASITLIDVAAGVWQVKYVSDASGSEGTPFSVT